MNFTNVFCILFLVTIITYISAASISDDFETTLDDEDLNLDNIEDTSNSHMNSKMLRYVCSTFCTNSGSGSGSADGYEGSAFSGGGLSTESPNDKSRQFYQTEILKEIRILKEKINQLIETTNEDSSKINENFVPPEYKTAYPIFMEKSVAGNYRLTFDQAERLCQQKGDVLATHMQMQTAWEKGMDVCSCGWVAEGHAIYPIQYPREGCTPELGPGIRLCTWQRQWNAWCFSKSRLEKNI